MTATKDFAQGDLLVTGRGEVIIDEALPRSRALLVQPDAYISVEFDPSEPPPPPCAGAIEELDWELFMRRGRGQQEEMMLKIKWNVSTARTILYHIKIPV